MVRGAGPLGRGVRGRGMRHGDRPRRRPAAHLHRTLASIRAAGARAGVALNPATPLESVRSVLHQVDLLLVMTVNPGFAGQAYIAQMQDKIREARALIDASRLEIVIEVDGGISSRTAPGARSAGAEMFVAGSAILGHPQGKAAGVGLLRASLERRVRCAPRVRGAGAVTGPRSAEAPATARSGDLDELCINTIRALAIDAVERAHSGHPGAPMGMAPMAYVLWTRFLRHNPSDPRVARPRPVRAVGRPRVDAAVRAPAPHGIRPAALGDQALPPVGIQDARAPRARTDAGRGDDDRPARPGLRERGGHGDRRAAPRGALQPRRARRRRSPHVRHLLGRRPDGGRRVARPRRSRATSACPS